LSYITYVRVLRLIQLVSQTAHDMAWFCICLWFHACSCTCMSDTYFLFFVIFERWTCLKSCCMARNIGDFM